MPNSTFYNLCEDDLRDTDKLRSLWRYLAHNESSPVTDTELDWIDLVSCAIRAIENGRPPMRLFRWLLANFSRAKELISVSEEKRALARIAEWKRGQYAT